MKIIFSSMWFFLTPPLPPPPTHTHTHTHTHTPHQVRATSSGGSSKESTPEASRNTPEAGKPNEGQKFMLKPLTSNKRKKKKVSPRTSPRILEEAAYLRQGSGEGGREGEGGKLDTQPAINSVSVVRSLGGTAPTVLSQLRRGSVEQAIKSFEKLHTTD